MNQVHPGLYASYNITFLLATITTNIMTFINENLNPSNNIFIYETVGTLTIN